MSCNPEKFYLYLSLDLFGMKKLMALLKGGIPLTNSRRFNDPFDSRPICDHSNQSFQSASGFVRSCERSKCEKGWENRYNVFCLSESPTSTLMWSHYADSHQGICLELNLNSNTQLPQGCLFQKVRYSTHLPKIDASRLDDIEEIKTFYLTKSTDWMYENEWRLLAPKEQYPKNSEFDGFIEKSPFQLVSIICGLKSEKLKQFQEWQNDNQRLGILTDEFIEGTLFVLNGETIKENPSHTFDLLLKILVELQADPRKDTVEVAECKRAIFKSIVFEFFELYEASLSIMKNNGSFGVKVSHGVNPNANTIASLTRFQ